MTIEEIYCHRKMEYREETPMKINIYYGGRGLIDDPTIYVINKMTEVLEELNVQVTKYHLHEQKNAIPTLPQTLKEADGIILATTVEWLGIGGYMQQFLDACWLYGDKEKIAGIYMMPVVMSNTYGEREAKLTLQNSWEILGGMECDGICAYVEELLAFEMNEDYKLVIEKSAENLYRTISQKKKNLPTSTVAVKQRVLYSNHIELSPQESEQLSVFVSDETYIKKQKEDIEELASLFKSKLNQETSPPFIKEFEEHFVPQDDFTASYLLFCQNRPQAFKLEIERDKLHCAYTDQEEADMVIKLTSEVLSNIVNGRMTFQRAFMSGEMSTKGNFHMLRMLDDVFSFQQT